MKNPTLYLGCDAHKSMCVYCGLDEDGNTVWEGKTPTTREGFQHVRNRFRDYEVKVVVEALGFVWTVVNLLSELGFRVYVCNPAKNPQVGFSRKKTDLEDARKLAELLRVGYLNCIYIPTKQQRELRTLGRERHSLVKTRVRPVNQSRRAVYDHQVQRRKKIIDAIQEEVNLLNREIHANATVNEDIRLLMTTPGLAEYGATLVAGEVCSISRFPTCKQYLAYCGVVPSVRQSGNTVRMGATRKDSNSRLRWIYVQAAWVAIRWDSELANLFNRKARVKGKKKTIIVVAKKLATRNYWMLKNKQTYREAATAVKIIG